ncbi:MAG: hypothetical protein AAFX06_27095 [Planctomycetota bacterium]
MSQAPNNPLEQSYQQQPQPQSGGGGGGSNTWLWVLGIIGGLMLVSAIACCGLVWYGGSQFSNFVADAVMEEFKDDPMVVEHIGEITSSDMDFGEAMRASQNEDNVAVMIFNIEGDKGSGKIVHRTDNNSGEVTATLVLDNGDEYPLSVFDDDFGDDFDMDINIEEGVEEMPSLEPGVEAGA